jgi:hypothetical protein
MRLLSKSRRFNGLNLTGSIALWTPLLCSAALCHGQAASLTGGPLPEEPSRLMLQTTQTGGQKTSTERDGTLLGTINDTAGLPVPEAHIVLRGTGDVASITATTDVDGHFNIANLPLGVYTYTVTAQGFASYVSPGFAVRAGEQTLPVVTLTIAAANTTVQVTANVEQIAEAEVKAEEQQRFLGVLPDFYTSYTWDAAPLNPQQKFKLAAHSAFDPIAFLSTGLVAGIEQADNIYPAYHQGAEGFAKRYGASYADEAVGRFFASAVYPSIFHQDPRYFYKGPGGGSKPRRAFYAFSRAILTRSDSGRIVPNYSLIAGRLTAGAIAYSYHPAADRSVSLVFVNALLNIGGHAADNFAREFWIRKFTPSVPSFANGQGSATKP